MKQPLRILSIALLFTVFGMFFLTSPAVAQSESFLDTIYQANEGEADDSGLAPEPTVAEPSEDGQAQPQGDEGIAYRCPFSSAQSGGGIRSGSCGAGSCSASSGCSAARISPEQLQALIQQIIQKIMSQGGAGAGGRVIIIRIPCGGATGPGQQPQPGPGGNQQPPAPVPPGNGQPSDGQKPDASGIAGLKAEMRQKYGIDARDGDSTWSERQLEEANKVLATLPPGFRNHTKTIQRDGVFRSPGVLGYVRMGIPTVHMMNSSARQGTFQGTMVHEMTHTWQANNNALTNQYSRTFWPQGRNGGAQPPAVSQYGGTQPVEDMAEAVRAYWQNGPAMKRSHPKRYEWVKNNVMEGKEF